MAYLLVVDDDEDFTNAISMVLAEEGHEVHTEQEIESGLKSIKERPPDLLILDVMFPEDSSAGFELARTLGQEEKFKDIPILILSAVNAEFSLGFGSGDIDEEWLPAHEFLEKPMDFDMLISKVTELLQKSSSGSRGKETR